MTNVMRSGMTFPTALVIATNAAHAMPIVDPQRNVIDSMVGGSVIGGGSAQRLSK